jgi:glucokinase
MSSAVVLGLDVGGSSVKYRLASAGPSERIPEALEQGTVSTPKKDPVAGLAAIARDVTGEHRLVAVVVGIPGLVDEASGTVLRSANLPALDGLALGPALSAELDAPVAVINDGRAAAVAEARWGAGAGERDVFTLALGTGIAGSHIVDGRVVDGAHGIAGELGHVVVDPSGARCACGQRGCLETVVGAPALRRAWHRAGGDGSPKDLLAAYEAGDERAIRVVDRGASSLADAILTLLALVDPGVIVIGGGLASAPHRIVVRARALVDERATFHRVPPIVPATLGKWAGAVGAVAEARELAGRVPVGVSLN